MAPERAVVTGVGLAVTGVDGVDDLLDAGQRARTGPDAERATGFDPATELRGRDLRHKDRASRFALRAVEPALRDAGLLDEEAYTGPGQSTAVVVSSNLGNLDSVCVFADTIAEHTISALSPLGLPQTSTNEIAGWVAIRYQLRGPNLTLCNGVTSGLDALYWARNLIAARRCDVVVVIGVEPNTEPVSRLLDDGSGRPLLDGAGALVLESAGHAESRGAHVRAEAHGYARAAGLSTAVEQACAADSQPVGLLLGPEDAGVATTRVLDLTARLGHCSGALGVLQCAVGVGYLRQGGGRAVLAVGSGETEDDAAAALLLTPAGGAA